MLFPTPPLFRRNRGRAEPRPKAPAAALTLTEAFYDAGALTITLSFDRAIDVAGIDGSQVGVNDPESNHHRYAATGTVELVSPASVQIGLSAVGSSTGTDLVLNASAITGIVATDDGGTWAGAMDLELPFP
jgi:hypothetical protein